jgi:hypothetical protein
MNLDPEELIALAQNDPGELENLRLKLIEEVIGAAPEAQRARLRGLQFRIDMERQRASNALGACIKLNTMMWDSFVALRESVAQLTEPDGAPAIVRISEPAKVIPFATPVSRSSAD